MEIYCSAIHSTYVREHSIVIVLSNVLKLTSQPTFGKKDNYDDDNNEYDDLDK